MTKDCVLAGVRQLSLFGDEDAAAKPIRIAKPAGWKLVDHACKSCMGRLVSRKVGRREEFRCCECGQTALGSHDALCWCGVEVRTHGKAFECIVNDAKSPALLNEILVAERKITPAVIPQPKTVKSAFAPEYDFI